MSSDKAVKRRRYGQEIKTRVMAECDAPGASVARVSMAHGINANIVHRWRQLARQGVQATAALPRQFVPVAMAPLSRTQAHGAHAIEVELRRGAVTMKVSWPSAAVVEFAAWTRELLR